MAAGDGKSNPDTPREAKLAQALRANLRRRKASSDAKSDAAAKKAANTSD